MDVVEASYGFGIVILEFVDELVGPDDVIKDRFAYDRDVEGSRGENYLERVFAGCIDE